MADLNYRPLAALRPLEIRQLYSVHYFEYDGSYVFPGESHDFWELLYVDRGAVDVTAGDRSHHLTQGQMIFHQPGEFHALSAAGTPPDLVVASFACGSPAMDLFRRRVTVLLPQERALMARIVMESVESFSTPLNDPRTLELRRRDRQPFGSEQLLCAALEELLIRLIRRRAEPPLPAIRRDGDDSALEQVMAYLDQRLGQPLTLEQICRDNLVSRSQLQKLFHAHTGGGVMTYFTQLKIQAARRMIREGRMNFTQISAALGFQSVNYFSRRFHLSTGMSPSEYARSVKMLSESPGASDDCANPIADRPFPFRPAPLTINEE